MIAEAGSLRPDLGVNDADYHIVSIAALVSQTRTLGCQSQKLRAVSGRHGVHSVRVQF